MKLKEDHLYLIKREALYFLVYPVYDLKGDQEAWENQLGQRYPVFADDDIIESVERIEERKHDRQKMICECGNPECDGSGNYRRSGSLIPVYPNKNPFE